MKRITNFLLIWCLAISATMFVGCQKDDFGTTIIPTQAVVKASVVGQVFDETGKPVKDAEVRLTDGTTTKTDVNGNFTFQNQKLGSPYAYVKVSKSGYFNASRTFSCKNGQVHYVKMQLLPKTVRGSFTSASGGTVSFGGVEISLPANGVMLQNGALYNGIVSVVAQYLNPQDNNLQEIMPGDLMGYDTNSKLQLMKTFGMVAVELLGQNGEVLQVATGSEATLSLPQIGGMTTNGDMPLWYFDENAGFWKQEGFAKLENGKWVGKVKHFSFWNCDTPQAAINLDMTLVDYQGNVLPNLHVMLVSSNYGTRDGHTNSNGYVGGLIPSNEILTMNVYDNCGLIVMTQQIGPFAVSTNLGNVVINGIQNSAVTYTGIAVDCMSQPLANGVIRVEISNGSSTSFYMTSVNSTTGAFSITIPFCQNGLNAVIYAMDLNTLTMSAPPVSATVAAGTQNVGLLTVCGGPAIAEYIQLTIDGTPSIITGGITCTVSMDSAVVGNELLYVNGNDAVGMVGFSVSATPPNPVTGNVGYMWFSIVGGGSTQTIPGLITNITAYPTLVGDYFDGNFTTTYTDGTGTHNLNVLYHVKKD